MEESRLPRGTEARTIMALTIGCDGMRILEGIYDNPTTPLWLREIPAIETLRITWIHQYWIDNGELHWRNHQDLPPSGLRSNSPYDTEKYFTHLFLCITKQEPHNTFLAY